MGTMFQVVFDCADPARVARFWAEVLGYKLEDPPEGYASWEDFLRDGVPEDQWDVMSAVVDPDGKLPRLFFQKVPEGKAVKNRVHLDVNVAGGQDRAPDERTAGLAAEADRLVALGATKLREFDEFGQYWLAMLDPEGNEFDLQ